MLYIKKTKYIHQNPTKKKTGFQTNSVYTLKKRRLAIRDEENKQAIELITNQIYETANTISELYKTRWDIEFF